MTSDLTYLRCSSYIDKRINLIFIFKLIIVKKFKNFKNYTVILITSKLFYKN